MQVSVVIPALISNNHQISMTMSCINKAKKLTGVDFETVIVETKSNFLNDEADLYLWEREITNATKSINRGFKIATGDFIVLLTNDVMVSDNWLEALLEPFDKKEDCGLTTLATTQFNHHQADKIEEGIWFSVACFKKQDKYFDEGYVNSWDDTDFIMRHYLQGLKMYRNYACVVDHLIGQTQYEKKDHQDNFWKNRFRFIDKYKTCGNPMYDRLIGGEVI